jgi:hypothetical protein
MQQTTLVDSENPTSSKRRGDFFATKDMSQMPHLKVVEIAEHEACEFGGGIMTDLIFKITVNQFSGVIRQHGIAGESETMLAMLESLVIAGEIPLPDFMDRVQNLFPHIFALVDRGLLSKLTTIAVD